MMDEINTNKQMLKEENSLLLVPIMLINWAIRTSIDKKIPLAIRTSFDKKISLFHKNLMFKQVLEIFCIYLIQVLANSESRQDDDLAQT